MGETRVRRKVLMGERVLNGAEFYDVTRSNHATFYLSTILFFLVRFCEEGDVSVLMLSASVLRGRA